MPHQRLGPAPPKTTPGQEQGDTRPASLPRAKTSRKSRAHTSPSQHPRSRRRQGDPSWRGFAVRLYLRPGSNAHSLYALLRAAAERYGLEVADVREIHDPE